MGKFISRIIYSIITIGCIVQCKVQSPPILPSPIDVCSEINNKFYQIDKYKEAQITVLNGVVMGKKITKKNIGYDQKYPLRVNLFPLEEKQYKHIGIEFFFRMDASNFMAENLPVKSFSYKINILDDNECRRINQNLYECYVSEKIMADLCSGGIREVSGYEIIWSTEFSIKARSVYQVDEREINQNVGGSQITDNCNFTLLGSWSDYTSGQIFNCELENSSD
jgi:hypothetical protein